LGLIRIFGKGTNNFPYSSTLFAEKFGRLRFFSYLRHANVALRRPATLGSVRKPTVATSLGQQRPPRISTAPAAHISSGRC